MRMPERGARTVRPQSGRGRPCPSHGTGPQLPPEVVAVWPLEVCAGCADQDVKPLEVGVVDLDFVDEDAADVEVVELLAAVVAARAAMFAPSPTKAAIDRAAAATLARPAACGRVRRRLLGASIVPASLKGCG